MYAWVLCVYVCLPACARVCVCTPHLHTAHMLEGLMQEGYK